MSFILLLFFLQWHGHRLGMWLEETRSVKSHLLVLKRALILRVRFRVVVSTPSRSSKRGTYVSRVERKRFSLISLSSHCALWATRINYHYTRSSNIHGLQRIYRPVSVNVPRVLFMVDDVLLLLLLFCFPFRIIRLNKIFFRFFNELSRTSLFRMFLSENKFSFTVLPWLA